MMEDWILCRDCEHCTKPKWMDDFKGSCDVDDAIIGVCVPRTCPYYIPVKGNSTCEGFVKVNEENLKSKEENTMNETGKIFDEISEILNKKNEEIEELHKKLIAFESANKENKKLVERLDERISEKNREIEELNNKLIKTRSEVNEANIRNNLLEFKNNSLVKDNLEQLEENRGFVEECGKLHDILCKNCKYDNDVDDICFRACKCGSHFCPEDSKELRKKIECLTEENKGLADEATRALKEKEFYINRGKYLVEKIDELKKQIDSVFYDILDSDKLGLPHCNYLTRNNRYPIYRYNDVNNMVIKDFTLVGYLYVKDIDKEENLTCKTIGEVKSWCIREDEVYDDNTKIVKIPKHRIAIAPMRKDGIEAAEKWVIE